MPEDFFRYALIGGGALSLLAAVNFKEMVGELLSKSIAEKPQRLIFNQEDKLFLNGHGKEFLVSSNFVDNVDTTIYAIIKDKDCKEVKTSMEKLYLKKRLNLRTEIEIVLGKVESNLVRLRTLRLLIEGGMKEGKSSTIKSIKEFFEKFGYTIVGTAPINCNSSEQSVTKNVYSYKFQKIINDIPVEIEVIDTPGLWDTPKNGSEIIHYNQRRILEKTLRGSVKNGASEEDILEDKPFGKTDERIPKPNVVIACFKYSQMLNGFSCERFKELKTISEKIGN